jgi:U4/U6 small nuclear ribonucleoprotein PRP31
MYIRSVRALANFEVSLAASNRANPNTTQDPTKVQLDGILPPAIKMSLLMTSTNTLGVPLTDQQWGTVEKAIDMADKLDEIKWKVSIKWTKKSFSNSISDIFVC